MERDLIKAILENVLFVSDSPLSLDRIVALFEGEVTKEEIAEALEELKEDFESRALELTEIAEGWRFQTRAEYSQWITRFFKMERGQKLSRASLEVLAIIAYRQPITRAEIDEIRGVDSGGVLRNLIDKSLVKTMGRRKVPGRPMMYGTTSRFLEYFGLARLADLPTMEEFQKELEGMQESLAFEEERTPRGADAAGDEGSIDMENEDYIEEEYDSENSEDLETSEEEPGVHEHNEEDEINAFRY